MNVPTLTPAFPFLHLPGALEECFGILDGSIQWEQKELSMYGRTFPVPRLTAMYGSAYSYSGINHPARAMGPRLQAILEKVTRLTGVHGLNSVLCNKYEDGSHKVGWHSDNEAGLGPHIVSVSFGASRTFKLRTKARRDAGSRVCQASFQLDHGDVLIMGPGAQERWEHCIPRTSKPVGPRINLTFRRIE